jgi:hypothetical protein
MNTAIRRFALPLLAAAALAGCKSQAAATPDALAPAFAGYWASGQRGTTCADGALRFDRTEIVQIRRGLPVPIFQVLDARVQGDVAELTLRISPSASAMALRKDSQRKEADTTRFYLTLVNHGDRIVMRDVQMHNEAKGRHLPSRGNRARIEKVFGAGKCPA